MTAAEFIETLKLIGNEHAGSIPKRDIFSLAKEFQNMSVAEVVQLLKTENDDYRLGAVSILDWKARLKKLQYKKKKQLITLT